MIKLILTLSLALLLAGCAARLGGGRNGVTIGVGLSPMVYSSPIHYRRGPGFRHRVHHRRHWR